MTDEERFWSKVDKNGPIPKSCPELGACWIWTASKTRGGYGKFRMSNPRRYVKTHRHSFFLAHGYQAQNACHHCDNPSCCNPAHLFDGTNSDNMRDCVRKGRARKVWPKGENSSAAKLTALQVAEIRRLRRSGLFLKDIAARYGVVYQTIQRIIEGKSWRESNG